MIDIAGKISGKTVVVTGGSGYIGSALTEELSKYNLRVIRTGRKKIAPKSNVEDWVLDLNDSDSWYKIVSEVDIIFHLAGNTSVYDAEENPEDSLTSTLFPIIKLINASRKLNRIPRIVFASTATIYGLTSIFPVSELTRINPITTYDLHKLFSENELAMATENKIISAISLRLANVYGASTEKSSAKDRGVLNKVTKAALRGHDLTVYGDGKCVRDYIYIDDVIDAFLYAATLDDENMGSYNIASQTGYSLGKTFTIVADSVAKITGNRVEVSYSEWPKDMNPIEHRNFIGDISKFKHVTGWTPKVSLHSGLERMINFFMEK